MFVDFIRLEVDGRGFEGKSWCSDVRCDAGLPRPKPRKDGVCKFITQCT